MSASFAEPINVESFTPYHSGKATRGSQVPPEHRRFIAWDGEGINRAGPNRPQSYVLFGCSTGEHISSDTHLHTFDLLDFILDVGSKNPTAFHVGFAFGYDSNMVLRSLHESTLARIHKDGGAYIRRVGFGKYYVQYRPGKWFSVTRFGENYDRKKNPHDRVSVRIHDMFGFFQKGFEAAYREWVGPVPEKLSEGKAARGEFQDMDYVREYWELEIGMLAELAERLRRVLYGAGLRITSWYGPGVLANYTLRANGIRDHMAVCPDEVREAARYGYAGGRFERFRLGRTIGPVYSLDINSAYPFGIWQLPSLAGGQWHKQIGRPTRLARFGIYKVRLLPHAASSFVERAISPLFHRDKLGNISFPWILEGWYWSPEVQNLLRLHPDRYEIVEGWEFKAASKERPFLFVQDLYDKRRDWKSRGIAGERAIKLQLNSLYGKMAQRVGWNREKGTAPTWHQLEWAGWVTSNTRAMLWEVMSRLPGDSVIAVETDGLYTTESPERFGITDSKALGGWEVTVYDEILYVQSGMAWLRKGTCTDSRCVHQDERGRSVDGCAWTCKRRGLDMHTFSLGNCIDYLGTLGPKQEWAPFVGSTTRFIGLGAALGSSAPTKVRHCVWETVQREISPGTGGKRVHVHSQCSACADGFTAYEAAHDMSIRSLAYGDPVSHPHDIPWEGHDDYPWREQQDMDRHLVRA